MLRINIKSLRTRLLLLITLTIIPLFIFTLYSSFEQRKHREAEIEIDVMTKARQAANNLDQLFSGSRQILTGFAELPAVLKHDATACNAFVAAFKKKLPMYANLAAAKENGDVFCSAASQTLKVNVSDRPYFKMAIQNKRYIIGDYLVARLFNRPAITASMPVMDSKMRVKTVVFASIDLEWLEKELGKIELSKGNHEVLTILDRNYTVLFRNPDSQKWIGKKTSDTALTIKIGVLKEGVLTATSGLDGIERIWAFTSVPGLDDSIFVRYGASRKLFFSEINRTLRNNLLGLFAITILALLIAWFGSDKLILHRIKLLQKATDALGKGNLTVRLDVSASKDEISRLGSDFNKMAAALESQNQMRRISEEKYRTLFDESLDAIFVSTPEGKYLDINQAGVELFGYSSKEEMLGLDINKDIYLNLEDRIAYKQILEEQGFVKDYELRLKRKDGGIVTILASAIAVRDKHGNIVEYRGINRDITKHKQAEKELAEITQRLQLAVNSAELGIWDWDTVNNSMVWDDPMLELYGLTRETFSGGIEAWHNGLHPEDRITTIEECQAALRGDKEWDTEFRIIQPNGTVKHIKANGIVIRDSVGKHIRMLGINFDITAHRNLERQLRQTQKMEAIGQLAGGVAHDFNNLLQAIFANVHLLKIRHKNHGIDVEEVSEIDALSNRAVALTQSLLAFSRKQHINIKPMNLNASIRETEKILARTIGEDIHLTLQLTEANTTVHADSNQIGQILINLAANARDAMPKGGELTIRTELTFLDKAFVKMHGYGRFGEYVLMTVTDTGIGMDAATRQSIFEPFFTTKQVGKGTGLGLSTVYGIVTQHEGFIDVYSELDKGTVFKVYLPALEEKAEAKESNGHFELEAATETVMLVEDDSSLRLAMAKMLQGFGYTVIEACDGDEAVAKFVEHKNEIHLVLMDVIMPRKGGADAFRELKATKPDIEIILMSGYAGDFLSGKLRMEDDIHFITKPISPKELYAKIRSVLKS